MKNLFQFIIVACLVTSTNLFAATSTGPVNGKPEMHWEVLGSKTVNYLIDRDEIDVTASEGTFTALKLKVTRSALNVHKFIIYFGDGSTQEVDLKKNFKVGEESRVIDLKGNTRTISKVVFWYDTKNNKNKKAVVELWGRH